MTEPAHLSLASKEVLVLRMSEKNDAATALQLAHETGLLVVLLSDGATLEALDEDDMRAAGWVKAEREKAPAF